MSLGSNIKRIREEKKLTQEQLGNMLDVSFQTISSWERDEYYPSLNKLICLADSLNVSYSYLLEEHNQLFEKKDTIYNWEHMKTYIKTTAKNLDLSNTLIALNLAIDAYEENKKGKIELSIYHPLNVACHALALNIEEDNIIATCLLHDVIENSYIKLNDLNLNDEIKNLLKLLTFNKDFDNVDKYYKNIEANPKAALIKCIDKCNSLSTMCTSFGRDKIAKIIEETEKYYRKLLKSIKNVKKYNNAFWLLQYQIESMLNIYKSLI